MKNGKPVIEHAIAPPSIYLDTWMWREFSKDTVLQNKFIQTANDVGDTLMYSVALLMELAFITDQKQLNEMIKVMDSGVLCTNPRKIS